MIKYFVSYVFTVANGHGYGHTTIDSNRPITGDEQIKLIEAEIVKINFAAQPEAKVVVMNFIRLEVDAQ